MCHLDLEIILVKTLQDCNQIGLCEATTLVVFNNISSTIARPFQAKLCNVGALLIASQSVKVEQ
jgi:hypothetical protein